MNRLRTCVPEVTMLLQVSPDGSASGPLGPSFRLMLDQVRGFNVSFTWKDVVGSVTNKSSDHYDGCLGSLQSNQSDLLIGGFVNLPVPGGNLTRGAVDGFDRIGILSGYKRPDVGSGTQVLDMMLAFSWRLWLLVAGSFAILALLVHLLLSLRAGKPLRRRKHSPLFNSRFSKSRQKQLSSLLLSSLLKQESSQPQLPPRHSVRTALLSLTILSFYTSYYLTSMIKTQMVVVQPPVTIESYRDLLASDRRPAWVGLLTDSSSFRYAKPESLEGKVWQKALDMDLSKSMIPVTMTDTLAHGSAMANLQEVLLVQRFIGERLLPRAACAVARVTGSWLEYNTLFRFDPTSREKLRINVRSSFLPRSVSRRIDRRIAIRFAAGLEAGVLQSLDLSSALAITQSARERHHSSIEECASNVISIPTPETHAVVLRHFASLFALYFLCISFAALTLYSSITRSPSRHLTSTRILPTLCRPRDLRPSLRL